MQSLIRILSVVMLLAVVGYALTITGSPTHTRHVNEDIDTLRTLENMHRKLVYYYQLNKNTPLQTLDENALNTPPTNTADGCTNVYDYSHRLKAAELEKFEYSPQGNHYTICTSFHTSWRDVTLNQRFYGEGYDWAKDFQQGRHCFERTIPACKKRKTP